MKHSISGRVEFFKNWSVAWVDNSLAEYYRSLIPKYIDLQPPRYKAHITIVRKDIETASHNWGYRDGDTISIQYVPQIRTDGLYYWLDAYSDDICRMREKLGLPRYRIGFDRLHITIANTKL